MQTKKRTIRKPRVRKTTLKTPTSQLQTIPEQTRVEPCIDTMQAIKMRFKNKNSFSEIGARFGVSAQAAQQHLAKVFAYIDDPEITEQYENQKADILSSVERKLVSQLLDDDKLQKASLNNVAYAYSQVANQNRLQRGQATEISQYSDMTMKEGEIQAELDKLRAMVLPGECVRSDSPADVDKSPDPVTA